MEPQVTDMPFKLSATTIAVLKKLPVFQCDHCGEHAIEDLVMEGGHICCRRSTKSLNRESQVCRVMKRI